MNQIQPIAAETASPRLVAASLSTRTPAEVILARLTPLPRWDIWAVPQAEEPFHLEQTLTQLTNEEAALDCLQDVADNFDCVVIHTDASGKLTDVSEQFARKWALGMARAGFDAEALERMRFLSKHFTNDEIDGFCGRGGSYMR